MAKFTAHEPAVALHFGAAIYVGLDKTPELLAERTQVHLWYLSATAQAGAGYTEEIWQETPEVKEKFPELFAQPAYRTYLRRKMLIKFGAS